MKLDKLDFNTSHSVSSSNSTKKFWYKFNDTYNDVI